MPCFLVTRSRTVTIEQKVRLDAPDQQTAEDAEDLDWGSVPEAVVDVIETSITAEPI